MSGFVAILREDEGPVERRLLVRLTESMAERGPDAQGVRLLANVGLGHTMLRTTEEALDEAQPFGIDETIWISADARVDDRARLRRELRDAGRESRDSVPDCELILHAYQLWEADCLGHLIGDFSFAIWDAGRRRLFCARDHFGVKPLFYANVGGALVVSNTLDTVCRHPEVSTALDELAITDRMLFEFPQDPSATAYRDVRRVPPAHALIWERGRLSVRPYWRLEVDAPLSYRRDSDYLDHFHQVFSAAVGDRLRWPRVGISMSGGLDSTSVAAVANRLAQEGHGQCRLKAFTVAYERSTPDDERDWARLVADHLGIPIHFTLADTYEPLDSWTLGGGDKSLFADHARTLADFSAVMLTGYGGDPVNRGTSRWYLDLLARGRFGQLFSGVRKTLQAGKRPPLQMRTIWRRWRRKRRQMSMYPDWINPALEARLELQDRWRRVHSQVRAGWSGQADLASPFWAVLFESKDPGATGYPIEYRHPYFDLRVVSYMLRVPTLPWFLGKVLVRQAMQGLLPDAILGRPKAVVARSSDGQALRQHGRQWWLERLESSPSVAEFVNVDRLLEAVDRHLRLGEHDLDPLTRPVALALWLRSEEQNRYDELDGRAQSDSHPKQQIS